ncbi:hypothetical protein EBESD8_50430 [Rhodococcus aetherivorans]|nr:hypothetical protein EBESD8_50430 [Rhodococcus aetherivorans]
MLAALSRHSCHSASGSESMVMPPPTPRPHDPGVPASPPPNSTVRIATLSSSPASGLAMPTVPQYTPRGCGSQTRRNSRARSLGQPVTEAGGNAAPSNRAVSTPARSVAATVDTRCQTPGAGCTPSRSGTVTVPVSATRPRSLRTRSTIITFSATSLTDARSRAGSAPIGSVPLIGLDVTRSSWRARNNSGDSDATAPHPPAT